MATREEARAAREVAEQRVRDLGGDVVSVGLRSDVSGTGYIVSVAVAEPVPSSVVDRFDGEEPAYVDNVPIQLSRATSDAVATSR